jgi:hypothetical protein
MAARCVTFSRIPLLSLPTRKIQLNSLENFEETNLTTKTINYIWKLIRKLVEPMSLSVGTLSGGRLQ